MNEKSQTRDVLIKVLIIVICATLYCIGGAELGPGKWLRRFAMPIVMAGGMFWFSRDWKSLLTAPLVGIGASMGYGGTYEEWLKIIKRLYCGLALGIGSSFCDLLNKRFLMTGFQTILVMASMVVLGVYNPLPNARVEEFCIGALIVFLPIMSARRKLL